MSNGFYKARFQIEFIFRDAKQFTGLLDCQSCDADKLDFHFNASLTALNLAKADLLNQHCSHELSVSLSQATKGLHSMTISSNALFQCLRLTQL
jgi:hypothetical protein